MEFVIIDTRNDPEASRNRELRKLADNIIIWGALWDCPPGVGEFMKKYRNTLLKKGMADLNSTHFQHRIK